MPIAPAADARAAFASYGQPPRTTSAIAPFREFAGSAGPEPQSWRLAPPIAPTSTRRWLALIQDGRIESVATNGIRAIPLGDDTEIELPKTWRVHRRAHADRVGRRGGRARRPEAEEVAVVAGGDDRDDTGAHDVRNCGNEGVRARIGLRPAAREVDDVHAVRHRGLEGRDDLGRVPGAAAAERERDVEDAVVPDVGPRRDPAQVLDRRVAPALLLDAEARPAGGDVRLDARDDPCHVRPVERLLAVERSAVRARPGETARDDHLRRRRAAGPLG